MDLPFDIVDVESELNNQILRDFTGEKTQFLQVGSKKYLMPSGYRKEASNLFNFKVRTDDVWICTYPRSGTTMMQELLWLLTNDLNFAEAAATHLTERSPFLEFSTIVNEKFAEEIFQKVRGDPVKEAIAKKYVASKIPILDAALSPRVIKTHLPFSLLPPKLTDTCKVVYMARNPKDVVLSYYHHNKLINIIGYVSDFPQYYDYFERDLLISSPFWEHIHEAWDLKNNPNVLFLFYEDFTRDMKSTIRLVASFLNKHLDEDQVSQLVQHLSFDNFRNNTSVNKGHGVGLPDIWRKDAQPFIRKGKNNSWRAEFTPEINAKADKWIAENTFRIPNFAFPT